MKLHDSFCVFHYYDIGDQRVFVSRPSGDVDAKRAAIYCQRKCEEWFGEEKMVSNLGIASLLVTFYGFQHQAVTADCVKIDMHYDVLRCHGESFSQLLADPSLHRDDLRSAMAPHVTG